MGKLLNADYRQSFLLAPSVENWVPANHPVRVIRDLVDDAIRRGRLGTDQPESDQGRPQYAASLLLKIWVYAYVLRFRSTRKAEWACKNVMPMIWLAGGLRPDHNTLSRFWHENRQLVADFFRMTVGLAQKVDLIGMELQAVDGTKMQASGSTRRAMDRKQAEELLKHTEQTIAELEKQIANNETVAEFGHEAKLGEALEDRKQLKSEIEKALSTWSEAKQKRTLSEMEARMLVGTGMGYNAQVVVDAKAGILVAQDVVSDANDQKQLVPMLDKVKEELGAVAELTVADGGYNTAQSLGDAAQKDYPVLVNRSADERKGEKKPYHASHFTYDRDNDVVICPEGKRLEYTHSVKRRKTLRIRVYRSSECGQCPVRALCTKNRRGRAIEISEHHDAVIANRQRRQDPQNLNKLKSRITFGERPFAVIKDFLGFRRFRLKGKGGASLEWSFVNGVYNILRIAASVIRSKSDVFSRIACLLAGSRKRHVVILQPVHM